MEDNRFNTKKIYDLELRITGHLLAIADDLLWSMGSSKKGKPPLYIHPKIICNTLST
jgi:hypothetical protein